MSGPLSWRAIGMLCVLGGLSLLRGGLAWNGVVTLICGLGIVAGAGTRHSDVAGFGLLLGVAQAATMQALDTSHYAVYEHLPAWSTLVGSHIGLLLALVALLLAITTGFANSSGGASTIVAWSRRHPWRLAFICGVTAFAAAVPGRSATATITEFALGSLLYLTTAGAAVWLMIALSQQPSSALETYVRNRISWPGTGNEHRSWDAALPWSLAALAIVLSSAVALFVFEGMPHIDDSVSYLFQAKTFASGRLWLNAPVDSAAFHVDEVLIDESRWFGYGFPGWPAVLAAGVRIGIPWLINPLLAGVSVVVMHALVQRWHDRGTANAVAILMVASPWFLVMSGEFMPHALSLTLACAALYGAVRVRSGGSIVWSALTGVSLGWMVLTRPLDAILVTLLCAAVMLTVRPIGRLFGVGALSSACAAAVAVLVVPYNALLTGRGGYTPQMMWTDRRWGPGLDRYGFGPDIGIREWSQIDPLPGHGFLDVILNLNKNLAVSQRELFGWGTGSLLLIIVLMSFGRPHRRDVLWWSLAGLFVVAYSAYWFSGGPDLGARYWYPALVALVVLTVRAMVEIVQRSRSDTLGRSLGATAVILSFWSATVFVPARIDRKYMGYRNVTGDVRQLSDSLSLTNDLVFVRSPDRAHYQAAFNLNRVPSSVVHPLYAADAGPESRRRVVESFAERRVWVFAADSAGGRLSVSVGPLAPGTVP